MLLSIHDRVKAVRKALDMSQTTFGERLGVGIGVIKNIEYALVDPKDQFLSLICKVFGVDPIWLETGEGEMFHKPSEAEEMAAFSAKMISDPDPFKRRFFYALSRMDESGWDKVKEFLQFLKESEQKENDGN